MKVQWAGTASICWRNWLNSGYNFSFLMLHFPSRVCGALALWHDGRWRIFLSRICIVGVCHQTHQKFLCNMLHTSSRNSQLYEYSIWSLSKCAIVSLCKQQRVWSSFFIHHNIFIPTGYIRHATLIADKLALRTLLKSKYCIPVIFELDETDHSQPSPLT